MVRVLSIMSARVGSRAVLRLTSLIAALVAVPAMGSPYWVHWDASQGYPEDNGWERVHSDPPAQRWFDNGAFFIDSRQEWGITDWSRMSFPGIGTLGPGETFIMRWNLKVDYSSTLFGDPGVHVISDDLYAVAFIISDQRIYSVCESDKWADIEPGQFHEFELRSSDMRSYELDIDGTEALSGTFFDGIASRRVEWGDISTDLGLSEWNWAEFGIIPEPTGFSSVVLLALLRRRWES